MIVPLGLGLSLTVGLIGPAWAHGQGPVAPDDLWTHWSLDPLVWGPLLAVHWLYGRGWSALRRRLGRTPHALPGWRVASFLTGEAVLLVALVSPLAELSGTLFSAHMVQHVLLMTVAPPLLVLGRPEIAVAHGLPAAWRRAWARSPAARRLMRGLAAASRPLPATLLHGVAVWVWHAPAPFEAAAGDYWLHALEHLCFFGTALLFWRGLVASAGRPEAAAMGAAAALVTMVHGGFLSALLSFSPIVLYPAAGRWAPLWGLTPLEDQQLAGAIMGAPAGMIYLVAGLLLAARLLAPREPRRSAAVAVASQP